MVSSLPILPVTSWARPISATMTFCSAISPGCGLRTPATVKGRRTSLMRRLTVWPVLKWRRAPTQMGLDESRAVFGSYRIG